MGFLDWIRGSLAPAPDRPSGEAQAHTIPSNEGKELEPDNAVAIPITDALDLHPFRPREVKEVALSYLEAALEQGFEEVRLIHGRGIGVQREIVRKLLANHPDVERFRDAGPERGGWGATVVRLRRNLEPRG